MGLKTNNIFIAGAGAVGASMAAAFSEAGWKIIAVCDPDRMKAQKLAATLGIDNYFTSIKDLPCAEKGIVLLAVSDSSIRAIAKDAAENNLAHKDELWIHTAGSYGTKILEPLEEHCMTGAFHPAMVFPPGKTTKVVEGTYFGITGSSNAIKIMEELAKSTGGVAAIIKEDKRVHYHVAAVMASNYVAAILGEARDLLINAGVYKNDSEAIAVTLAQSSIKSISANGINAGLSGPCQRGDIQTIRRHEEVLKESKELHKLHKMLLASTSRLV